MLYNLFENRDFVSVFAVALLAEGVDRNSTPLSTNWTSFTSPSSQRAWIEMMKTELGEHAGDVALLAEGVDRNHNNCCDGWALLKVALLAEGVDRNE